MQLWRELQIVAMTAEGPKGTNSNPGHLSSCDCGNVARITAYSNFLQN